MSDSSDPLRNLPLVTEPRATKRAAGWQIALTALSFVAILTLFFFGINHQRNETASEQTAATTPTQVAPQGSEGQQQPQQQPSTTGQGDDKSNDQSDRAGADGQKTNAQPADSNGGAAQRRSK